MPKASQLSNVSNMNVVLTWYMWEALCQRGDNESWGQCRSQQYRRYRCTHTGSSCRTAYNEYIQEWGQTFGNNGSVVEEIKNESERICEYGYKIIIFCCFCFVLLIQQIGIQMYCVDVAVIISGPMFPVEWSRPTDLRPCALTKLAGTYQMTADCDMTWTIWYCIILYSHSIYHTNCMFEGFSDTMFIIFYADGLLKILQHARLCNRVFVVWPAEIQYESRNETSGWHSYVVLSPNE